MARPAKKTKKKVTTKVAKNIAKTRKKKTSGIKKKTTGLTRISKKQRAEWDSKSFDEQTQYLKDHPDSRFQKLGITKKGGEDPKPDNDTKPENTENTQTNTDTSTNTETETKTDNADKPAEEAKPEEPIVPKLDAKKPIKERVKDAFNSVFKVKPSFIKEQMAEGYKEGLEKALNNPLKLEELQRRREEYARNPPKKPKDEHDVLMMMVGIAAIVALGGLAVVSPGIAIVAGMSLMEHSGDIIRAVTDRQETRRSRKREEDEDEDDNRYTANLIGDPIEEKLEYYRKNNPKKYLDLRRQLREESKAALPNNDELEDIPDPSKQENESEKSDIKKPETVSDSQEKNTETGETKKQEGQDSKSNTAKPASVADEVKDLAQESEESDDEDEEDLEDDDEEDEPPPKSKKSNAKAKPNPKTKRRQKVKAILEIVESSFGPLHESKYQTAIDNTKQFIGALLGQRNTENEDENATFGKDKAKEESGKKGTYVALKLHPSSARLLSEWAKKKGIKNAFPPGEFHITVSYSKKPIDFKPLSFVHGGREVRAKNIGLLGRDEKKYLVLHLQPGGFPKRRFDYAMSIGATHDFPSFLPHISIAPPGHDIENPDSIDTSDLNFPLIVDYEYADELKVNASMDIPNAGFAIPKRNSVKMTFAKKDGSLKTGSGKILNYKLGDCILSDKSGESWSVKPDIFKQKYKENSDGTWDKKLIQYSYRISTKKQTIKTLEGPVVANVGDFIMTGTKNEEWPVSKERFHQLYSVIVNRGH